MSDALRFLGVGSAQAVELGSASAVFERDGAPVLLIDCGTEALTAYLERYGDVPRAVYITHTHFDHVGGLERLFYRLYFDEARRGAVKLFAHAALIPYLQERVANYPNVIAEGGANFWDAFRLVPCTRGFWLDNAWFDVFATRHHAPMTSFGVALEGRFVYTGDTRPIPELLSTYGSRSELIAHDCGRVGNPSHTGLDDLPREYDDAVRSRLVLYHYGSADDAAALRAAGYRVAEPGEAFVLGDTPVGSGETTSRTGTPPASR